MAREEVLQADFRLALGDKLLHNMPKILYRNILNYIINNKVHKDIKTSKIFILIFVIFFFKPKFNKLIRN